LNAVVEITTFFLQETSAAMFRQQAALVGEGFAFGYGTELTTLDLNGDK